MPLPPHISSQLAAATAEQLYAHFLTEGAAEADMLQAPLEALLLEYNPTHAATLTALAYYIAQTLNTLATDVRDKVPTHYGRLLLTQQEHRAVIAEALLVLTGKLVGHFFTGDTPDGRV